MPAWSFYLGASDPHRCRRSHQSSPANRDCSPTRRRFAAGWWSPPRLEAGSDGGRSPTPAVPRSADRCRPRPRRPPGDEGRSCESGFPQASPIQGCCRDRAVGQRRRRPDRRRCCGGRRPSRSRCRRCCWSTGAGAVGWRCCGGRRPSRSRCRRYAGRLGAGSGGRRSLSEPSVVVVAGRLGAGRESGVAISGDCVSARP